METAIGAFTSRDHAEKAVKELRERGVPEESIVFLTRVSSMQQMRTRGAMARRLMAFILVTFFSVGPAFGQTEQRGRFEIPYEFTVGS